MSELIFQDITNIIIPILIPIIQSYESSNWQWCNDWLQQVAVYRYYPACSILILKLKDCKSPDFYKSYISKNRFVHIHEALRKVWDTDDPLRKTQIIIFGKYESAEAWMKENCEVSA